MSQLMRKLRETDLEPNLNLLADDTIENFQ